MSTQTNATLFSLDAEYSGLVLQYDITVPADFLFICGSQQIRRDVGVSLN